MASSKQAALGFIFVTILIDVIGLGIIIPVVPKLIMQLTGEGNSIASEYGGWLTFAYSVMQFLFSPVLGNLSDRYGRRPILLFSLLGFGLDYVFVAFAPTIWWLFVGRVIAGVTGASFTTATAYIADISPPEKRAQNFGMVGAAFGLGFIIGPVLGGVLGQYGAKVPFLTAAGLSLLNALYGFFVLPESLPKENRRKFEWKRANPMGALLHLKKFPKISGLVISLVLVYIAAHAVQSTWTFYTIEKFEWDEKMIGYSLGVIGVLIFLVQGILIRKVIPKLGEERSVYIGLMLWSVGLVLFGLATQSWMMFAFSAVYCLGGIAGPAIQGIISNQVPSNEQGELQGGLTSLMSVTSIVGPPFMTTLFAWFTRPDHDFQLPGAPFLAAAVLTMVSAVLASRSFKKAVKI
ncbi:MAG: TCR/Tet family MFS transporter [Flavitalea sp.]